MKKALIRQWKNIDFTSRPGHDKYKRPSIDAFNDAQISFLVDIAQMRHRDFVTLDPEYQRNFAQDCIGQSPFSIWRKSLRWTDITGLFIPELIFKGAGTLFISAYSKSRDNLKNAKGFWPNLGWGIATGITGLFNAVIGQPLYFIGNVFSHAQTVIDGAANFVASPITAAIYRNKSTTDDPQEKPGYLQTLERIAGSSFGSMVKGTLMLAADAVVGAICYCVSLIPGAAPFTAALPNTAQTIIAAPINNIGNMAGAAVQGFFSNAWSKLIDCLVKPTQKRWNEKQIVYPESTNKGSVEPGTTNILLEGDDIMAYYAHLMQKEKQQNLQKNKPKTTISIDDLSRGKGPPKPEPQLKNKPLASKQNINAAIRNQGITKSNNRNTSITSPNNASTLRNGK